jgi:predicted hotdog family 3-hydroxylacyl-ACP dehydratase
VILDHQAIELLIPHQGSMCLLDSVEEWDAEHIVCATRQHALATNPLRIDGELSCVHGIEFAAQAMAVHGGLMAPAVTAPRIGLLLSVRQCIFHCTRLDNIDAPLRIEANRIAGSEAALSYRFAVHAARALLLEGRANVMLQKEKNR